MGRTPISVDRHARVAGRVPRSGLGRSVDRAHGRRGHGRLPAGTVGHGQTRLAAQEPRPALAAARREADGAVGGGLRVGPTVQRESETERQAKIATVPSGGRDLPRVVLIPTGRLSLLPLHAARYAVDGRDVSFVDEFTVSYAISATVLAKARQEATGSERHRTSSGGVGNPLPESAEAGEDRPGSLPFARAELESIADMLPDGAARTLYEHQATRQALLDALPGANLVHLSCHGRFRADDPLASGLLLADGELTLREIMAAGFSALSACRLAVLSACQTAIQDFSNLPDEAIGLPAGLTQAGVPAVVGTLWSVNDASTALLMVRFYEFLLQDRLPPPVALRRAQLWLRDITNAELDAYLSRHEAVARARRKSTQPADKMSLVHVHMLGRQARLGEPGERPYAIPTTGRRSCSTGPRRHCDGSGLGRAEAVSERAGRKIGAGI